MFNVYTGNDGPSPNSDAQRAKGSKRAPSDARLASFEPATRVRTGSGNPKASGSSGTGNGQPGQIGSGTGGQTPPNSDGSIPQRRLGKPTPYSGPLRRPGASEPQPDATDKKQSLSPRQRLGRPIPPSGLPKQPGVSVPQSNTAPPKREDVRLQYLRGREARLPTGRTPSQIISDMTPKFRTADAAPEKTPTTRPKTTPPDVTTKKPKAVPSASQKTFDAPPKYQPAKTPALSYRSSKTPSSGGGLSAKQLGGFVGGIGKTLGGLGALLQPLFNEQIAQIEAQNKLMLQSREHDFKTRLERGRFAAATSLQSQYQRHALRRMYVDFTHRTALVGADVAARKELSAMEHENTVERQRRVETLFTQGGLPAYFAHLSDTRNLDNLRVNQYLGARTTRSFLPTGAFYNYSYGQSRFGLGEVDVSRFGQSNYRNTTLSNPEPAPKPKPPPPPPPKPRRRKPANSWTRAKFGNGW